MNKEILISIIIERLSQDLSAAKKAADEARGAAQDDQSVAETQYDTLAIEASYLADGHNKRMAEIKAQILDFQSMPIALFPPDKAINIGALLLLASKENKNLWLFLSRTGGGLKVELDGVNIQVVTIASPLGKALIGNFEGDDINYGMGEHAIADEIIAVK